MSARIGQLELDSSNTNEDSTRNAPRYVDVLGYGNVLQQQNIDTNRKDLNRKNYAKVSVNRSLFFCLHGERPAI